MFKKLNTALIGSGEANGLLSELMLAMPNINLQIIIDPLAHIQISSAADVIIFTKLPSDLKNVISCLLENHKAILLSLDDFPLTNDQCKELFELNESKYGQRIYLGFKKRFQPNYLHIKQQLTNKKVGHIHLIKLTERFNKATTWQEAMLENIDLIHFLTEDKVTEIFAMTPFDSKPTTSLVISLKLLSGALVVIDINRAVNYGYDQRLEVFGSQGSLQISSQPTTNTRHYTNTHIMLENLPSNTASYWQPAYQLLLETFVNNAALLPNLNDYVRAKEVVKAAETAIIENKKQLLSHTPMTQGQVDATHN